MHNAARSGLLRHRLLRWPLLAALVPVVLLVVGLAAIFAPNAAGRNARAMHCLEWQSADMRKRGAWLTAEHRIARGHETIRLRLARALEADPDVRESYVYALGRIGDPADFDLLAELLARDESGYVRAAAWWACAQLDPTGFRELLRARQPVDEPWDRIGAAQGQMALGDAGGVDELLHWAMHGDHSQRVVSARALYRGVRPALEAAGRWPIAAQVVEGQQWPAELVCEVQTRCHQLDLQSIFDDSRPHLDKAQRVRRNVLRLTAARERLRKVLFAP